MTTIEIKMPDLATVDADVTLLRWLVEVGQTVQPGQPLFEIETDKASMDVEASVAGRLMAVYVQPGEQVAVGQLIAALEGVSTASVARSDTRPTANHDRQPAGQPVQHFVSPMLSSRVSLFARNKARRGSIDSIPLSAIQREVGRRMQYSKQTIPHFYLTTSANAERMAARRTPARLIWDAFFVYAAAKAITAFPRFACRLDNNRLVKNSNRAIGVAVDVEGELFVAAVENPLSLTLEQISERINTQAERIRQGDLAARRLTETTLTITNLGSENIDSFMAIVNPPEVAILSIGRVAPAVTVQGDQIVIQKRVALSLSADHRVVNGKYAAAFLSRIVSELEAL